MKGSAQTATNREKAGAQEKASGRIDILSSSSFLPVFYQSFTPFQCRNKLSDYYLFPHCHII